MIKRLQFFPPSCVEGVPELISWRPTSRPHHSLATARAFIMDEGDIAGALFQALSGAAMPSAGVGWKLDALANPSGHPLCQVKCASDTSHALHGDPLHPF